MEETILSLFYLRGHPFVIKTKRKCNTLLLFNRSVMSVFATPWTAACQASLSFTISWCFLKLMFIELVIHPTILSSVIPFSSCFQTFPESGPFPMSRLFASGSQSIGASASISVLPMNVQGWFPLGLTVFFFFFLLSAQNSLILSLLSFGNI